MGNILKRLYKQFQPSHYALELDLSPDSMKFTGRVIITGKKVGPPSKRLVFHQHGLTITTASIVKRSKHEDQHIAVDRINHHSTYDEVRLHSKDTIYPGTYAVTMSFRGKIQEGMHGIYLSRYKIKSKQAVVVSTQFESHHAREAFPGIDEPEAKATFDLTIITPNNTVLGNMPIKSQSKDSSKLVTTFDTTPLMSTYLLAFVYGDLQSKETTTKDNVQVRVWSTKAHSVDSLDYALNVVKDGIEFFNDYYGVPYPLPKCDNIALPEFSSGAMENWGLITYRESVLLVDPKTASQNNRETATLVCLHELSHQWFGNLVTMKWWDDLWLNESFANVMEYVAADALHPDWRVWDTFTSSEGLSAFRRDAINGVQAIKTPVNHPGEISTLFDPSIVYAKGGRLLNMLMNYIGEQDFKVGLRDYFVRHAYKNTTGDDLWESLGKASGKDVKAFMIPWLTQPGFPVVNVKQTDKKLTIGQTHFTLDPKKADSSRAWPVPTLCSDKSVLPLLASKDLKITLASSDFVRLNKGAVGHFIVNYQEPSHALTVARLISKHQISESERLMFLSDSSMLARGGVQAFASTLQLLEQYTNEDSEPVWDMIALILADLRRFIDSAPEIEGQIKALVRKLIETQFQRLGWQEDSDEPVQDTKLRATIISLGVYAKHKQITNHAIELFEIYKNDGAKIPAELRSTVFGAAVRNEVSGAFDYLLRLEESTSNVNLKQDIMSALTTTKISSEIKVLLDRLPYGQKVRLQDVDHWLAYLLRSRHAQEQAWDWMRKNWEWIEKNFSGDKSYDYFPRYAASALNTRKRLDEYVKFFGPYKSHPALGRNVAMGAEELSTRIEWLERDTELVRKYLKTHVS